MARCLRSASPAAHAETAAIISGVDGTIAIAIPAAPTASAPSDSRASAAASARGPATARAAGSPTR